MSSVVAEDSKPLFEANFNDGKIPEALVERFPKMVAKEGVLVVTQGGRHAASPTLIIPFNDAVFGFRFKLDSKMRHG